MRAGKVIWNAVIETEVSASNVKAVTRDQPTVVPASTSNILRYLEWEAQYVMKTSTPRIPVLDISTPRIPVLGFISHYQYAKYTYSGGRYIMRAMLKLLLGKTFWVAR